MKNIILGILGMGGLAGIAYIWTSWINNKSDINESIHKITQKIKQAKIETIEKEKVEVVKKIEDKEKLNEETKKEIIEIKEIANEGIKEILKRDNFEDLAKEVDKLW